MTQVVWTGASWSYVPQEPIIGPTTTRALVHGDCRLLLDILPEVEVVVTDPPYVWSPMLCKLQDAGVDLDGAQGLAWPVLVWMQQWYPLLCMRTRVGLWLTTDRLYLRYYELGRWPVRKWPLRGACDREPWLLWIGKHDLLREPSPAVLDLYRYGSDSPTEFWAALLALTPGDKGLLLDPFCGEGSILLAGRAAGYRTLGIEANAEIYQRCHARVMSPAEPTSCEPGPTGVYSGPPGPG